MVNGDIVGQPTAGRSIEDAFIYRTFQFCYKKNKIMMRKMMEGKMAVQNGNWTFI